MSSHHPAGEITGKRLAVLALAALGVVYGDIGTSPLYAMKEVFAGNHPIPVTEANIFGSLSLFFWALIVVVSVKYVSFIMRADNRGEGGIMALIALALHSTQGKPRQARAIMLVGVLGAAMFYGDGMVTPAISVLSAVEGLEVATPALKPFVIPLTLVVLFALFAVQRHGTAMMGAAFGPVMLLWFSTLAALGLYNIVQHPEILVAANPWYGIEFLFANKAMALVAMGNVVLAVTGAEALYADMGHFGQKPISRAWFAFVLPALVLNYFGQGALILAEPEAAQNPFFLSAPDWALYPLVGLATLATVIASQAGDLGRLLGDPAGDAAGFCAAHGSAAHLREGGRADLPAGGELGADAGGDDPGPRLQVVEQPGSCLRHRRDRRHGDHPRCSPPWLWPRSGNGAGSRPRLLFSCFLAVELVFLAANILKIPDGGWFPARRRSLRLRSDDNLEARSRAARRASGRGKADAADVPRVAGLVDADPGYRDSGISQCRSDWRAACAAAQPDA